MTSGSRRPRRGRSRSRSNTGRAASGDREHASTSTVPSPGSWNAGVDRGRSRVRKQSNPFSDDSMQVRGYHSLLSSFGKIFHVEKRWKIVREMGSGAYGVVVSAADEISGQTVAIKLVTRVFDKIQLAKRALREITLLRHFAHHENITGLIDVDAIDPTFNEIYIFMEPMEADLHQIIKSGQTLSNEHVQYFLYQILRGMKYIHSASVIHRDLKPGNLLVNADCELKICDFGLSRGYNSEPSQEDKENATRLTEYVATRWYRAPEIMLAFRKYDTAIDVWSIGCIFAELLLGKPLFKGKDYVDQLNKILNVLGTPEEYVLQKIGSEKAQAYVRSLPIRKKVPFQEIIPKADPQAIELLEKMLVFDPDKRISVFQALEHPWLASYHDYADEPTCPSRFDKWRKIEELETIDDFRKALWDEIEEYRLEVRRGGVPKPTETVPTDVSPSGDGTPLPQSVTPEDTTPKETPLIESPKEEISSFETSESPQPRPEEMEEDFDSTVDQSFGEIQLPPLPPPPVSAENHTRRSSSAGLTPSDPLLTYARRNSLLQSHSRQGSAYTSPVAASRQLPAQWLTGDTNADTLAAEDSLAQSTSTSTIAFPSQPVPSYVLPARSRTGSTVGKDTGRRLLRTLSTVSIHESAENHEGGLAGIAPIGKYITAAQTAGDAPPSEMPREFGIDEEEDGPVDSSDESAEDEEKPEQQKRARKFTIH